MGTYQELTTFIFRLDCGNAVGLGHLMRCVALAQAATQKGIRCIFALSKEGADIASRLPGWQFTIATVSALDEPSEGAQLQALCDYYNAAALVVDSYRVTSRLFERTTQSDVLVVTIDDGLKNLVGHADVVINSARVDSADYRTINPAIVCCVGSEYRLLRQEFVEANVPAFVDRDGLVVSFGGSDPFHYTVSLLEALHSINFSAPVCVVTGPAYGDLNTLTQLISASSLSIQHVHNSANMADVWMLARLAVSAAGSSQFELAACRTPAVLVTVAQNQQVLSEQASEQGWCKVVDGRSGLDMPALAQQVGKLYADNEGLCTMSELAAQYSHTRGAEKVVKTLITQLQRRAHSNHKV